MHHWAAAVNKPWSEAAPVLQLVCSQQEHCLPHRVHFRQQENSRVTVSNRTSTMGKGARKYKLLPADLLPAMLPVPSVEVLPQVKQQHHH